MMRWRPTRATNWAFPPPRAPGRCKPRWHRPSVSLGALLPLLVALWVPVAWTRPALVASALISLGILGGIAAKTGGAPILPGVARILIWSALAMAVSSGVGMLFGVAAG